MIHSANVRRTALIACVALIACTSVQRGGGVHARFAYTEESGLRVAELPATGPAAQAGLRRNDRVIQIDGEPVRSLDYADIVQSLRGAPGTKVELRVVRDGKVKDLIITRKPYKPR